MAVHPNENKSKLITFTVNVNGSPIKGSYQVKEIKIQKEINKIPVARLSLLDGEVGEESFPISDADDFKPGTEIEIKAGYNSEETTVFKGIILKHGLKISCSSTELQIECKDKAVKLTVNKSNRYFDGGTEGIKDSAVITQILSDAYTGTSEVEDSTATYEKVVQYYSSDWDFIVCRAELNGQVVIVNDEKISIAKPKVSETEVLEIQYGTDIQDFQGEMDARSQFTSIQGSAWDIKSQALLQTTAENPSIPTQGDLDSSTLAKVLNISQVNLQSVVPLKKESLQAWADSLLMKSWMSRIKGNFKIQGHSAAIPGAIVKLTGVGKRFNGSAYISKVEHQISQGDWQTTIHVGLSEEWFTEKQQISSLPASGALPGISGLQIGKVDAFETDSSNEIRVKVKFPLLQDDKNSLWARLSSFYATSAQGGSFFIPEKDDEVIVGFLNDDPRFPIILGSLYSSTNKPPYDLSENNFQKGFVTKGQCKVLFDDEKKTIQITTPGKNMITITDDQSGSVTIQDQNSNTVKLSQAGIDLDCAKDMNITVKSNLTISANGNVSITAKGNLDMKGAAVSSTANGAYKASGNASFEASSSGIMTIKGSQVMIN